jgi:hypothetical protein
VPHVVLQGPAQSAWDNERLQDLLRGSRGWQQLKAREHQQELAGGLRVPAFDVWCNSKDRLIIY